MAQQSVSTDSVHQLDTLTREPVSSQLMWWVVCVKVWLRGRAAVCGVQSPTHAGPQGQCNEGNRNHDRFQQSYHQWKIGSGSVLSNIEVFCKFAPGFKPKHGVIIQPIVAKTGHFCLVLIPYETEQAAHNSGILSDRTYYKINLIILRMRMTYICDSDEKRHTEMPVLRGQRACHAKVWCACWVPALGYFLSTEESTFEVQCLN